MNRFKDAEHLVRVVLVFAAGTMAFVLLRAVLVPRSFGEYGYYRGNAIGEISAQPVVFGGHESCESCHTDVVSVKNPGKHAGVRCEACHGALAEHAGDPSTEPPTLDTAVLCVRCHSVNAAKPASFPQVAPEHGGGLACDTCHRPHSPVISSGAK